MNLVQFLNKVDETISGYDCEKLLRIIHEIARTLPEQERKDFIKQIKQIDNNDTSNINKKDNNKLETEYKKYVISSLKLKMVIYFYVKNIMMNMMTGITAQ